MKLEIEIQNKYIIPPLPPIRTHANVESLRLPFEGVHFIYPEKIMKKLPSAIFEYEFEWRYCRKVFSTDSSG